MKSVLGAETKVSYAADWSEYFGHQPTDGSGDVFFHLDPLWADAHVDFVGIDNYMPLSDWRDGDDHLDAATWDSGRDAAYLRANIAGGEYFDWYYASDADRDAQVRSGHQRRHLWQALGVPPQGHRRLVGEPAFRPAGRRRKRNADRLGAGGQADLVRRDRLPGGGQGTEPAQRLSRSEVFGEPPAALFERRARRPRPAAFHRRGAWVLEPGRSRLLRTTPTRSPSVYGGRMVDHAAIHLWTWDARPYPAFPLLTDVWSDGANWETGHWLNGRLGAPTAESLVAQILADYGTTAATVGDLDGTVDGYLIDQVMSARDAIEPLSRLLAFEAAESGDVFRFVRRGRRPHQTFTA